MLRRRLWLWVLIWTATAAICAEAISLIDSGNQHKYAVLIRSGAVITGRVTETDAGNHGMVYYAFVVGGRRYSSGWPSDPPNPDATQLRPGSPLYITYDREDPELSCACDPHVLATSNVWWRRLLAGFWLGSVVSIILTVMIDRRLARRHVLRRTS